MRTIKILSSAPVQRYEHFLADKQQHELTLIGDFITIEDNDANKKTPGPEKEVVVKPHPGGTVVGPSDGKPDDKPPVVVPPVVPPVIPPVKPDEKDNK